VTSVVARRRIEQLFAKGETAMKLITAIIRPDKLDELVPVLIASQVPGLTVTEVRGFGRQYGRLAGQAAAATGLLPKVRLDIVVLDDEAEAVAEVIAKQARTETIGDGKIWITPVDGILRVRTGERDRAAV
jgi:nitrogen regulatory protein P-II 1